MDQVKLLLLLLLLLLPPPTDPQSFDRTRALATLAIHQFIIGGSAMKWRGRRRPIDNPSQSIKLTKTLIHCRASPQFRRPRRRHRPRRVAEAPVSIRPGEAGEVTAEAPASAEAPEAAAHFEVKRPFQFDRERWAR